MVDVDAGVDDPDLDPLARQPQFFAGVRDAREVSRREKGGFDAVLLFGLLGGLFWLLDGQDGEDGFDVFGLEYFVQVFVFGLDGDPVPDFRVGVGDFDALRGC